jgi:hypothetical protein
MLGQTEKADFILMALVSTPEAGIWYVVTAFRMQRRRAMRIYERG